MASVKRKKLIKLTNKHKLHKKKKKMIEVLTEEEKAQILKAFERMSDLDVSNIIRLLLRLKCIFLLEKEVDLLKNKNILREVNTYMKTSKQINIHKILLTIVKSFTEKYFAELKEHLNVILEKVQTPLGGGSVQQGEKILNNCLVILEKRMFQNLFEELNQEPLNYLMVFNKFDFDFIMNDERYNLSLDSDTFSFKLDHGFDELKTCKIKSVNIYELIRYVYYNAVINAKKITSKRIFQQFIEDNSIKDLRKGKYNKDPCEKYMRRKTRVKENTHTDRGKDDDKLKVGEYLIKQIWDYLPNLKNPLVLEREAMNGQLNNLLSYQPKCDIDTSYTDMDDDDDKINNWNYMVTRDGETMYLNAPTYKYFGDFLPITTRTPQVKPTLTESDFSRKEPTGDKKKQLASDTFDKTMEEILEGSRILVGDQLSPIKKRSKSERIMSYFKIRNKVKKKELVQNQLWEQFNKRYFSFDEIDPFESDKKCSYPLRPHEFYDHVPRYMTGKVRPIQFLVDNVKYLCAACGLFITRGKGVIALGYKWHEEHFKCRICCESFPKTSNFILYRGTILCTYDAEKILHITVNTSRCKT